MRIFDCVIIGSQLDLLEARFRELAEVPEVTFVIAESAEDYQGNPKPAYFAESRDRFAAWHGRYNHVLAEAGELSGEPRERKDQLRDYLSHGFNGEPGDIVMISNPDEIPSADAVRRLGETPLPVTLGMGDWRGTVVQERQHIGSFSGLRRRRKDLPLVPGAGTRHAREQYE
jgi:hypothetical protein